MKAKLLPCPFCGTRAYAVDQGSRQMVECGGCGVEVEGFDMADAIKEWNTRTGLADAFLRLVRRALERVKNRKLRRDPNLGHHGLCRVWFTGECDCLASAATHAERQDAEERLGPQDG